MIEIELRGDIARPEDGAMLVRMGFEDTVCSVESVRRALDAAPDDPDVTIHINSCGGYVSEGLAIYDVLRTSGRNIHTDIIGSCHSMAVCILLAAPFEHRTANPNARALIHRVYAPGRESMSAADAMELAQELAKEEDAILDIYQERTGQPREVLEALMDAEQVQDAQALLEHGFISKINSYNTNKSEIMAKNANTASRWEKFLANARNTLGLDARNYDYTDADGTVLFSIEGDEDTLAVGSVVRIPDGGTSGTFTLADGRTVTVEEGVVTEIRDAETENSARIEELEGLVNEGVAAIEELTARNEQLEAERQRLSAENASLRSQVRSRGVPRNRLSAPGARSAGQLSAEELKNRACEAREAFHGKSNLKN